MASFGRGRTASVTGRAQLTWLSVIRRYLIATLIGHLVWEIVQLPLYTLWSTGSAQNIAFAILHCTGGDVVIALTALILAVALTGTANWPREGFRRVAACAIPGGLAYTVWSEHLNTVVRQAWTYADAMPIVPGLGTGLAPALQWVIVPMLALWVASGRPLRWPGAGKAFYTNQQNE